MPSRRSPMTAQGLTAVKMAEDGSWDLEPRHLEPQAKAKVKVTVCASWPNAAKMAEDGSWDVEPRHLEPRHLEPRWPRWNLVAAAPSVAGPEVASA